MNDPPLVVKDISNIVVNEGASGIELDLSEYFNDVDGDTLTFGATSSDTSLVEVDVSGSILELSFVENAYGATTVNVTAEDPAGATATINFDVSINPVNDPATGSVVISGNFEEGGVLSSTVSIDDPDGIASTSYAWKMADSENGTYTAASGTNDGAGYTIASDQSMIDKWIRLKVIVEDTFGGKIILNSSATQIVNNPPLFYVSNAPVAEPNHY